MVDLADGVCWLVRTASCFMAGALSPCPPTEEGAKVLGGMGGSLL